VQAGGSRPARFSPASASPIVEFRAQESELEEIFMSIVRQERQGGR